MGRKQQHHRNSGPLGSGVFGPLLGILALVLLAMTGCGAWETRLADEKLLDTHSDYGGVVACVSYMLHHYADTEEESRDMLLALGEAGDQRGAEALIWYLTESEQGSPYELALAARMLGRIGAPGTREVLEKAVASGRLPEYDAISAMAELAMYKNDLEALNDVVHALESDEREMVRISATWGLYPVSRKQAEVLAALDQAARSDPSMRVRATAACVMTLRGDKRYWPLLESAAVDPDPVARGLVALYAPMGEQGIPLLLRLLTDEDASVSRNAFQRLDRTLDAEYPNPLNQAPQDAESKRKMAEAYRKAWEESRSK